MNIDNIQRQLLKAKTASFGIVIALMGYALNTKPVLLAGLLVFVFGMFLRLCVVAAAKMKS
jgi:hypothetical protein